MKIAVIGAEGKTGGSRFCEAAWRNLRDAALGVIAESARPMISMPSIRGG
jgi:putative NADH-flavin reductase